MKNYIRVAHFQAGSSGMTFKDTTLLGAASPRILILMITHTLTCPLTPAGEQTPKNVEVHSVDGTGTGAYTKSANGKHAAFAFVKFTLHRGRLSWDR
jgi:hypothetical protein